MTSEAAVTDMLIERDVPIPMDNGVVLRADVFRPRGDRTAPVLMTLGPYGKGVRYQDGYAPQWHWLIGEHPDLLKGSTRRYLNWETVDPEVGVPWGYAVVRVDARGAGRSPGLLDPLSPRETRDDYGRSADFSKVVVPLLSAANWAGVGLHPRGNFEGFTESASTQKWLEAHPGRHEEYFYLPYGLDLQKRFLDYFLKGEANGWEREPRVWLTIRRVDGFTPPQEHEWPLARTRWTRLYLHADGVRLAWRAPGNVSSIGTHPINAGRSQHGKALL
jgi:predicted acyl esterase